MRILHICNDFTGSKVHMNLYKELDLQLNSQIVYTYFDGMQRVGLNFFEGNNTRIIYDDILNPYIRKIYPLKCWWVYKHMISSISPNSIDCVFATTLFSDGGLAYRLYKQYKIPYIVAVRMTDMGTYLNATKFLWHYGRLVLKHAKKIVVINYALKNALQTHPFSMDMWDEIKEKVIVRPNGIDSFWLENITNEKHENDASVCYVGNFSNRKNVLRLIYAIDILHHDYPQISLTLIGENGDQEEEIKRCARSRPYIHLIGPIHDKNLLLKQYRQHSIFAMASLSETFGLVYIEALSQNLKLLYSKGTGIDGLLDNVGVAVDARSVDCIANGIRQLLEHYDEFNGVSQIDFNSFNWKTISKQYISLFEDIT